MAYEILSTITKKDFSFASGCWEFSILDIFLSMEAPRRSISRLTLTTELTSLFVMRIGDKCDADLAVSRCDKHFTAALIGLFSVTTSDPCRPNQSFFRHD